MKRYEIFSGQEFNNLKKNVKYFTIINDKQNIKVGLNKVSSFNINNIDQHYCFGQVIDLTLFVTPEAKIGEVSIPNDSLVYLDYDHYLTDKYIVSNIVKLKEFLEICEKNGLYHEDVNMIKNEIAKNWGDKVTQGYGGTSSTQFFV